MVAYAACSSAAFSVLVVMVAEDMMDGSSGEEEERKEIVRELGGEGWRKGGRGEADIVTQGVVCILG